MTFKHRLARRLAQSRTIGGAIALTLFGACSGGSDAAGPTPDSLVAATPQPGTITTVQNSSKCLDVISKSTQDGAALITYACNGGSNQVFTYYTDTQELRAYNGTKCVDASGELGRDGDPIIIWSCNGGANQKWQWTSAKEIKGINGKCIDLSGGSAVDKATLILKTCSGASSQKWDASRVMVSGTTSPPSGTGEQARWSDAFVNTIGVATHLNYTNIPSWNNYSGIIKPRLLELGVRHIRDGMQVWPATVTKYQDLAANGIRLTAVCVPTGWYQNAPNWSQTECVTQAGQIGTASLETFEGMNEVDNTGGSGWTTKYKTFQQSLWNAVKNNATWRSTPVAATSLAHYYNAPQVGNVSAYMDYGNMHPYPGGGMPTNGLQLNITNFQLIAGSKPLIATETGYHNAVAATSGQPGVSERASGKYYSRLFFEYFNAGVLRTYAYDLINDGTASTNSEHNFGLLRYDGSPKPQFTAIKNIIALLKDPGSTFTPAQLSYSLSGTNSNVHRTLLQKRDGRFYLVLWQEVNSWNISSKSDINVAPLTVTLQLGKAASSVKVYRPVSSTTPIAQFSATQKVSLSVPDEALIVEIAF
jgi:hypothetical protein